MEWRHQLHARLGLNSRAATVAGSYVGSAKISSRKAGLSEVEIYFRLLAFMGKRTLHFDNPRQLSQLYGGNEYNLRSIESKYGAQIVSRDGWLQVEGEDGVV